MITLIMIIIRVKITFSKYIPILFAVLLILTTDISFLLAKKSARFPKAIAMKYNAMYGRDEYNPFWKV